MIEQERKHYADRGWGEWATVERATGRMVGVCGLILWPDVDGAEELEVAFLFAKRYWGKGYGTEVATAVLKQALEIRPDPISLIYPDNAASIAIAKKIGTLDISIRKAGGCQAVPRHPSIHGRLEEVVRMENEQFEFDGLGDKCDAYDALNHAYTLDPYGPAGTKGGLLDQARAVRNSGFEEPSRLRVLPPQANASRISCLSLFLSFRHDTRNSVIDPSDGVSSPPIRLSRVVLPLPDGPAMERNSPGSTSRETPRSAGTTVLPSW